METMDGAALWSGPVPAKQRQTDAKAPDIHPNFRTQEVTDLSSVASAKNFHSNLTVLVLFA